MKGLTTGILGLLILAFTIVPISALEINKYNISPEYADVLSFHSLDNASLALYEGQNALQAGRYEEALSAYTNATESDPTFMAAWYLKAYTLTRLNRSSEALAAVDRALVLAPSDKDSNALKADILDSLGRKTEAAAYRVTLSTPPPYPSCHETHKGPIVAPCSHGGTHGRVGNCPGLQYTG